MTGKNDSVPKVSVLMTVYNAGSYLEDSIQSILDQTFQNWELIVVDDGSTDNSLNILKDFVDDRIRKFKLDHIGRTPALRYAFEKASGEYIAVLDADDLSHPNRLEQEVKYLDNNPYCVLVATSFSQIDQDGNLLSTRIISEEELNFPEVLTYSNPISHSSVMYRKEKAQQVGGYDLQFQYAQDYGLWIRLSELGEIGVISDVLTYNRVVKDSMTYKDEYKEARYMEKRALLKLAKECISMGPTEKKMQRIQLSRNKWSYGYSLLFDEKRIVKGLFLMTCSIFEYPSMFLNKVFSYVRT